MGITRDGTLVLPETFDYQGRGEIAMSIDVHAAYRQWVYGLVGPFNPEDAYCAGYALALMMKDEEQRRENNPVMRALKQVEGMIGRLR